MITSEQFSRCFNLFLHILKENVQRPLKSVREICILTFGTFNGLNIRLCNTDIEASAVTIFHYKQISNSPFRNLCREFIQAPLKFRPSDMLLFSSMVKRI